MLVNGDFELDWEEESSHRCLEVPLDGAPFERERGECHTPPGWLTWFLHDGENWAEPEVRDAWKHHDSSRVNTGEKSIMLFTFFRRHDAGFLQTVDTVPGKTLRLTAWAHAWSNHHTEEDGGKRDDPDWSDGVGEAVHAVSEIDAPPLSGDPQNDAIRNYTFTIGIDPTGGTHPYADTVIWSEGWHIYNGFCKELVVEAETIGDKATVFLRGDAKWPFKHNDAYWDTVKLEYVEKPDATLELPDSVEANGETFSISAVSPAALTNVMIGLSPALSLSACIVSRRGELYVWTWKANADTAGTYTITFWADGVPEKTGEFSIMAVQRGNPRVQYDRTYVLVPPSADEDFVLAIIDNGGWNEARFTIGGSADDAGIGDLDVRRIIAVNPDEWNGDLKAFFEEYYPGVEYVEVAATQETVGYEIKDVLGLNGADSWWKYVLWQLDYAGQTFGHGALIDKLGCFITGLAMAQRIFGIDDNATPLTVDASVGSDGYTADNRLLWSAAEKYLGITISSGTEEEARAYIENGGICMGEVEPQEYEHFILVVDVDNEGSFEAIDPLFGDVLWVEERYPEGIQSWRILQPTAQPPLPVDTPHIYGMHDDQNHEVARLMKDNGIKGHIVITEAIGHDPNDHSGRDYYADINNGGEFDHIVVVRLNNGYASSGTVPVPDKYGDFVKRVQNYVANSKGCYIWIIGNEQNNPREYPGNNHGVGGSVIEPELYADLFNACRDAIKEVQPDAIVILGAIDGYNGQWGDVREYARVMWSRIDDADAVCVHAYTHGPSINLLTSLIEFGNAPLLGVNYNFFNFASILNALPQWAKELPVYMTETNHLYLEDSPNPQPPTFGWVTDETEWISSMYDVVNGWNAAEKQQIVCVTPFRWIYAPDEAGNEWSIHGKSNLISDFTTAMKKGYKPHA